MVLPEFMIEIEYVVSIFSVIRRCSLLLTMKERLNMSIRSNRTLLANFLDQTLQTLPHTTPGEDDEYLTAKLQYAVNWFRSLNRNQGGHPPRLSTMHAHRLIRTFAPAHFWMESPDMPDSLELVTPALDESCPDQAWTTEGIQSLYNPNLVHIVIDLDGGCLGLLMHPPQKSDISRCIAHIAHRIKNILCGHGLAMPLEDLRELHPDPGLGTDYMPLVHPDAIIDGSTFSPTRQWPEEDRLLLW
jgi:hypothetical protein